MKKAIYFMKEWQGMGKFVCLSFGIALFGISDHCCAAVHNPNSPGGDANDAELQEVLRLSRLEWEQNDPEIQAAIRDSLEQRRNQTNLYGGMQPRPVSPTNPQGVTQPRPASPNQNGREEEEDPELQEALRLSMMWRAGGENGPLPASGPQQGLPNEQQNDAQIRAEQDRDFAAVLARQQAAEQLDHETNAPIANPDESVNLQTPEEMFSGLSEGELLAIGCPLVRKRRDAFIRTMFPGFDAAGSLGDRFYAILNGLAQMYQLNKICQGQGYKEVIKKLIGAWSKAFHNWNGHEQILDNLKPIAKNLPEDIISSDTLRLLP